ncbi:MAG: response regulator [Verrucomicrobiota bacterium]|nr:response regulator [Verrucomicrobiota bacterium]
MPSLRVLLIEDDPNDRALINRYLRQHLHDYSITEVGTREEYQHALNAEQVPDVILTDYYLGWGTGLDIIPEVRRRWSDVIVIMVTITGREEIAVEALKLGADDYILKRSDDLSRLGPAVRASLEMRENRRNLRNVEKRRTLLLEILEGTPDYILTATSTLDIIYLNYSARQLLGWTQGAQLGRLVDLFPEAMQARFLNEVLPAAIQHGTWSGEWVMTIPGGTLPVYQTLIVHRETDGQPAHYTLWAHNFSDRKKIEEDLLAVNRTLEETNQRLTVAVDEAKKRTHEALEANRAKSDFLAVISHELRTPLNPILGFSELLLSTTEDGEQRQIISMIHQAGEQLHALIQDVLNFSRIEARKVDVHLDWFPAAAFFADILSPYCTFAQQKNLVYTEQGMDTLAPWQIKLDAVLIRQILGNLLGNALKFTASGGISVSFSVLEPRTEASMLVIDIRDTGIGIPNDKLERVFEPFYQVDSSSARRYGGIGLGLSISHQLICQLGGTLTVASKEKQGSTFTVRLPLLFETLPDLKSNKKSEHPRIHLRDILIVEDDHTNQRVLSLFIQRCTDATPVILQSATECLQHLETHPCQIILLDLHLPDIDGFACMDVITSRFITNHDARPYVIAVTADVRSETQQRCLRHGINDFLAKPIDIGNLQAVLTRAAKSKGIRVDFSA